MTTASCLLGKWVSIYDGITEYQTTGKWASRCASNGVPHSETFLGLFAELFPTGVARRIRMYPRDSTSSFLCSRGVEGAFYWGFERWLLIDIGTGFSRQTSMKNMSWDKIGTEALFSAFVVFPDPFGTISLLQFIDGAAHPWFPVSCNRIPSHYPASPTQSLQRPR
jgi:hypothetical protein